jgi:hypothetical protein
MSNAKHTAEKTMSEKITDEQIAILLRKSEWTADEAAAAQEEWDMIQRSIGIMDAGVTLSECEISEIMQCDDWTVEDAIEAQAMADRHLNA